MARQTDEEEILIDKLLEMLKEKHHNYKPAQYCHYVVKGEYEEECDSEEYCEKCIDKAVLNFRDRHNKKRAEKLLQLKDLKEKGYCIHWVWNKQYECRSLAIYMSNDTALIDKNITETEKKYPKNETFSYRYYQLDSRTSCEICEDCGIIIQSCVTADDQEIEHWESFEDEHYLVSEMSDYIAYQIYEWVQFIHQAEQDVYDTGIKIIKRIIDLNH